MKRALLVLTIPVAPGATLHAQLPAPPDHWGNGLGFGVVAGLSAPTGDFAKLAERGSTVSGLLTYQQPYERLGLRGEASLSQFTYRNMPNARARIVSATANVVDFSPSYMGLYILGGVGIYHASSVGDACTTTATKGGLNFGFGLRMELGGAEALFEARVHHIAGRLDPTNSGLNSGTSFYPFSFGLKF